MTDLSQTIRMVPLDQLFLHPMNPRQQVTDEDVAAMAQSLASAGLLQNLCGIEENGRIGIVAGGRRLRGLQLLAAQGWEARGLAGAIDPVPVQITRDATEARAWALAENVTHSALHPAEEIRAYGEQATHGVPVETIARAFGKTERHVRQRLKLAGLAAPVLDLLAADRIGLSAAEALCLSEDPARQIAMAETAAARGLSAAQIRGELKGAAIPASDRRAIFLGLADYEADGGIVARDLFTDDAFLEDAAKLDRLWSAKLEREAARIAEEEGWSWVETSEDSYTPWSLTDKMDRLRPEPVELPEGDAEELDRLQAVHPEDRTAAQTARMRDLARRAAGEFSEAQRETGGIVVYVNSRGELTVDRAWRKPERKKTRGGQSDGPGRDKPALPQNAVEDLRRIGHAALQVALIDQTELLLDLFAWQCEARLPSWGGALGVSLVAPLIQPEKDSGFHHDARLPDLSPNTAAPRGWDDFTAFRAQGKKHRNQVLARPLARSANGPASGPLAEILAQQVDAQRVVRKIWTPDAANYFGRIRPDLQVAIWEELTGAEGDELKRFTDLKKSERAKELEALFADASVQEALGLSRDQVKAIDAWLPEELRT
ncbi:MAG: ParB/RepB/Spo0J family partition protein [Rhodobacteraceae bacterium]|nr:ParB/RepB/Spo0J family partition protein [Paracoccaceae bacterium]